MNHYHKGAKGSSNSGIKPSSHHATSTAVEIQNRRTSVARGLQPEDPVPEFKASPQMSWTLLDYQRGLPGRLSIMPPHLVEDT